MTDLAEAVNAAEEAATRLSTWLSKRSRPRGKAGIWRQLHVNFLPGHASDAATALYDAVRRRRWTRFLAVPAGQPAGSVGVAVVKRGRVSVRAACQYDFHSDEVVYRIDVIGSRCR